MNNPIKILSLYLLCLFLTICCPLFAAADDILEKGIAEFKAENYEEALSLFRQIKQDSRLYSIASFYSGLAYKQIGDYREAAGHFRNAVNFEPRVNDAYVELIDVLYNLEELKEAKRWIAEAEKHKIKPGHVAFLKGLVFLKEDKAKDAVDAFKKAKELDASLAQSADFQIAMAYSKERRLTKARESLKAVIAVDPTSELASFAKEYENAFAKAIEAHKTWRFTAGIAYQFDSNVVAKPLTDTGVNISGQRDTSVISSFKIDYSPLIEGQWLFNAQYSAIYNEYAQTRSYNMFAQSLSLIPGYTFNDSVVTSPLSYSRIWLKDHKYMSLISWKPTLSLMFLPGHIGQVSAGYTKRELLQPPSDVNEDRDGEIQSVSIGYIYPFSDGKGMFNVRYEYSKDDTDGKNWDNRGNRATVSILVPVTSKIGLTLSGDMFLQRYDNVHTSFGKKRKERAYTGTSGITWEMLKGLSLNLQYSYNRTDSNIATYDYRKEVYTTGLEYSF